MARAWITKRDTVSDTNEVAATFNATYLVSPAIPFTLKAGLDTVNRRVNSRQVSPRRWNRVANPAGPSGTLLPLSGLPLMSLTRFEEKNAAAGQRIPTFDPVAVNEELSDPTRWTEDLVYAAQQPYVGRRLMDEGVDAAYIQGQGKLGRLTLLAGVRVEDVSVDTFTYVKYLATPVAVEPDPVKRAKLDYGASSPDGGYTKLFPGVHLAFDITHNLKARASWSMSYGRPTVPQLIPALSFNDTNETVTGGNPSLGPQLARNIDVKLEYYFKSSGLFSVGVFEKKITDYILNRALGIVQSGPDNGYEGNFAGYTITAPSNAGDARIRGWEADYRQRLTFLPGLLKGLTFAANYTWLESKGRFAGIVPIATNGARTINVGMSGQF